MAHDVFISYASEDKTTADAVCARLESHRIRCWIAPRDVLPSMDFGQALVEAIRQSRLVVLVFSAHSNDSPHVKREAERAVANGIPILPFRIEDVTPSSALEYFIAGAHWLDALTPPLERHLERLAETVGLLLSRTATPPAISQEQEAPRRESVFAAPSPALAALGAVGSALLRHGLEALRMAGRLLRYTAATVVRRPLPSALAAAGVCVVILVALVVVAVQGGGGNGSDNGQKGAVALAPTATTSVATNTPKPAGTPSAVRTTPTVAGETPTVAGKTPTIAPGTPPATQGTPAAGALPYGKADQFAMVASPDCVAPGGRIEATWSAVDWEGGDLVALFPAAGRDDKYSDYEWQFVPTTGGRVIFPAPSTLGQYEVRLVRSLSMHLITSNPISVQDGCPFASALPDLAGYSVNASPPCLAPGGRVEVTWSDAAWQGGDLVALLPAAARDDEYSSYEYQWAQTASGQVILPAPSTPGQYEVRLVRSLSTHVAASQPITVSDNCQQ